MGSGDMTRRMPRVQQLWISLNVSRFAACQGPDRRELVAMPIWELKDPDVQEAWQNLTDPANLTELEQWSTELEDPSIKDGVAKAIQVCRARAQKAEC